MRAFFAIGACVLAVCCRPSAAASVDAALDALPDVPLPDGGPVAATADRGNIGDLGFEPIPRRQLPDGCLLAIAGNRTDTSQPASLVLAMVMLLLATWRGRSCRRRQRLPCLEGNKPGRRR